MIAFHVGWVWVVCDISVPPLELGALPKGNRAVNRIGPGGARNVHQNRTVILNRGLYVFFRFRPARTYFKSAKMYERLIANAFLNPCGDTHTPSNPESDLDAVNQNSYSFSKA